VSLECRRDGSFVLDGVKTLVSDGGSAELLLVVGRLPGTQGEDGGSHSCVSIERLPV